MKKISKKKIIINIAIVALILGLVLFFTLKLTNISQVGETFSKTNIKYALLALFIMVLSSALSGLSSTILTYDKNPKIGFLNAFLINNTENFFNGITPFASGSQPFQAYYYMKKGYDGEEATSVLLSNTIIYSILITLSSTISIIIGYNDLKTILKSQMYVVYVGWMINLLFTIGILLLVYVKSFYKLVIKILRLLSKIKFLKNKMEKLISKTPEFVISYQNSVRQLFKKPKVLIPSTFFKVISIFLFHTIAYILALTLGFSVGPKDFTYFFTASMVATALMAWFPLPGASGGTEGSLFLLFSNYKFNGLYLNSSEVATLLLFIRLVTYYFGMLYGFIILVIFGFFEIKTKIQENLYSKLVIYKLVNNKPLNIAYFTDIFDIKLYNKIKELYPNSNIVVYSSRKNKSYENIDIKYIHIFRFLDKSFFYFFIFSIFKIGVFFDRDKNLDIIINDSKLSIGLYSTIYSVYYKIPNIFVLNKTKSIKKRLFYNSRVKYITYNSNIQFITAKQEYEYLKNKNIKVKNSILYFNNIENIEIKNIIYKKTGILNILKNKDIFKLSYYHKNDLKTFYLNTKNIIFKKDKKN